MQTTLILLLIISDIVIPPNIDPLQISVNIEEQRAFIKCHVLLCSTVPEISKMLTKLASLNAIKMRQISIFTINFGMKGVHHAKTSHAVRDLELQQMKNINIHLENS